MPTLFHIEASPRGSQSQSTIVAAPLATALTGRGWALDHLDLWDADLPEFDGAAIAAKYAALRGAPHDPAEAAAWRMIAAMVARLDRADRILVSTPMWNFGIPYKLKHWIDLATQPGLSFAFDPASGYTPLLRDRPVTIVLASAGDYSEGPSFGRPDLASGYLKAALGFLGLTSIEIVPVGPTVGDPARVAAARERAETRIAAIAGEA